MVVRDGSVREEQGHPDQQGEPRIKFIEAEPRRGVNKREASACNDYPEEWPEEFICHGAKAGIVIGGINLALSGSGFELQLNPGWLLPGQEDCFVSSPKVKTTFAIEALGPLVRFVYQQANGFRIFKQTAHER